MSVVYRQEQLKISIAKILQTLGWNSITTTPLEILTDILSNFISQIGVTSMNYASEFGCTQPNIDHLGLTFRDLSINITELEEYVRYVNFGPAPKPVPKFPIPKDDHLNFLKPGSKEVVTRPVHIHEHLPPMHPLLEGAEPEPETITVKKEEPNETNIDNLQVFKKPPDVVPTEFKKPSFRREEEGSRPTREISSVMMTTSGFLSPAREGKLPESRTPITSLPEPTLTPPVSQPQEIPVPDTNTNKKIIKPIKKVEKKKEKIIKNHMKNDEIKVKKLFAAKTKQRLNATDNKLQLNGKLNQNLKANKALAAARLKTEKLNTTITPITVKSVNNLSNNITDNVDKLFTEPDKKKMNIFKKISNVKNEKNDIRINNNIKKDQELRDESRESSPDLIIDEPEEIVAKISQLPSDITIEPINPPNNKSLIEKLDTPYFDDDSPPRTPSTPKTPEMISHSPPMVKEKRKRKDSGRVRKIQKHQSPHRLDPDALDINMERPKTPEVLPKPDLLQPPLGPIPPFPFIANFGGPGLIPAPIVNAMGFPPFNMPNFGQSQPFLPPVPHLPLNNATTTPTIPLLHPSLHPSLHQPKSDDINMNPLIPDKYLQSVNDLSPNILSPKLEKKSKEHKKDKKDKLKKRNKKDKIKDKAEKKKLKEEKKEKIKKEKREKRKEKEFKESENPMKITLTIKSPAVRAETPETRKLNIKPVVKKDEETNDERKRETSPGLAKISALVTGPPKQKASATTSQSAEETVQETPVTPLPRTGPGPGRPRIHPLKPQPPKPKKQRRSPVKKDAEGNEVWICPGCGRQDDGSPMIGCDGCDAWYHWVCVGIQVPPDENEDWYCRHCLLKKNEDLQSDKQKKKRKKREKKEH